MKTRLSLIVLPMILSISCAKVTGGGASGLTLNDESRSGIVNGGKVVSFDRGQKRAWIGVVQAKELSPVEKAFLDVIAAAEGTSIIEKLEQRNVWSQVLCGREGGYTAQYGCFESANRMISSFDRHPNSVYVSNWGRRTGHRGSAAAGRYQFMPATWNDIPRAITEVWGFRPEGQDRAAIYLISRRGALGLVKAISKDGRHNPQTFNLALNRLAPEWASLPNRSGESHYRQPVKDGGELFSIYEQAYALYDGSSEIAETPAQSSHTADQASATDSVDDAEANPKVGSSDPNCEGQEQLMPWELLKCSPSDFEWKREE